LHKFFIIRLIYGLVVLFSLPSSTFFQIQANRNLINDRFYEEQRYLKQINFTPSSAAQKNSHEVVVAIIDEGVDFSHPDLQNTAFSNSRELENRMDDDNNGYINDIQGWNFLDGTNNLSPKGPHGTRLAGIIAAKSGNYEGIVGISQSTKIMSLIACNALDGCSPKAIVEAIYYAVDNGANVINLSFGDVSGFSDVYSSAINYANQKGVIVVAAAGGISQGQDLSTRPISPVCNEPVIGVSSIDEKGALPIWANFGACVDVYAPGTNIFTTTAFLYDQNLYGYYSGSSYSAAEVTGFIALLKSIKPNISQNEVMSLIKNQRLDAAASVLAVQPSVAQKPKPIAKVKGAATIKKVYTPINIPRISFNRPKEKLR